MTRTNPNINRSIYLICDYDTGSVEALSKDQYILFLQRSLCELIHIAKEAGLNDNVRVNQAKELIRCRELKCGFAGACNGAPDHCPLAPIRTK